MRTYTSYSKARVDIFQRKYALDILIESGMLDCRGGQGRGRGGGRSGGCPQCTYGKRFGHIEDKCYSLIGFLEKPINTTQSNDSGKDFEQRSINRNVVSDDEYEAYL
ncbi:hypothetical protein KIW84_033360 [Lathyrus oleraceus]|uniref:Uncharacterized protein n=1 Tax=Pisum sativum TaxID=3888 RepID=A0A9D5AZU6_PEA|nr:hypothetical protein KIW84_033360 [Pisum sativum]